MHTKGPWKITEIKGTGLFIEAKVDIGEEDMSNGVLQPIYDINLRPELYVGEDGSVTMRLCYESWRQFPSTNFNEMQRANARLIAAAPELLEALENISMTADQSGLDSQSTYDGVLEDIYEATQEAIRKATSHADTLKGE